MIEPTTIVVSRNEKDGERKTWLLTLKEVKKLWAADMSAKLGALKGGGVERIKGGGGNGLESKGKR